MTPLSCSQACALASVEDRELLRRVREEGDEEARLALHGRHLAWVGAVVICHGRGYGLSREDMEDVQAIASFALWAVLPKFCPDRGVKFHTLLGRVVERCVWKFVRTRARAERHYTRSSGAAAIFLGVREYGADSVPWRLVADDREPDPTVLAERRELLAALEAVLDHGGEGAHELWGALLARRSLHELAEELGLTYKQARRLKWRVEESLDAELRRFFE